EVLGPVVGVVVLYLVIVPRAKPRVRGVRRLKIGIALVERVTDPILVERAGLRRVVLAHVVLTPGRLVDVVAEVEDQVEIVREHVVIRGVVALLVLLAGGDRETKAVGARGPRGAPR